MNSAQPGIESAAAAASAPASVADHPCQIDRQAASTAMITSSPVKAESRPHPAGNDGLLSLPSSVSAAATRRPLVRNLDLIAAQLSTPDWQLLRAVEAHGFLTAAQAHQLHGDGQRHPRRTQARLARLRRLRVLAVLDRRIGGIQAGSHGLVYYLGEVGDRLCRADSGRQTRQRLATRSQRFVAHSLACAQLHADLATADRSQALALLDCQLEPACWRTHTGLGGAVLTLKPDLYVETTLDQASDTFNTWFIEIDLGTEHLPTQLRKCRDYMAYEHQGTEQDRYGGGFPLVVWSLSHRDPATAERRRQALREAIERDPRLDLGLFRVVASSQLLTLMQNGGQ